LYSGSAPSNQPPAKIKPRADGRMRPVTQAIQLAMFRVDRGDSVPRIVKLGELIARRALAGDKDAWQIVLDRIDGKAMPLDDKGEPVDLHGSVVKQLIELLHGAKMEAKVIDVVAEMVDNKLKE
jgi:hypothetical protein